jgi:hypothetical protein
LAREAICVGGGREEKIERKKIQIWACRNGVQILNQLVEGSVSTTRV